MGTDSETALWHVFRAIARDRLGPGTRRLVELAIQRDPENATLKQVRRIGFEADAKRIARKVKEIMLGLDLDIQRVYFGLDGLNMARGKGIEFGAASDGSDESFGAVRAEIPSKALSAAYRRIETPWPDYLIALGYMGLALRDAFEALAKQWPTDRQPVEVVFGHHDGDLYPLGVLGRRGFRLQLSHLRRPARSGKKAKDLWVQAWPSTNGPKDWLIAMADIAESLVDPAQYTREMSLAIDRLVQRGSLEDAANCVAKLSRRVDLASPSIPESGCEAAARLHLALGEDRKARELAKRVWDGKTRSGNLDSFERGIIRRAIVWLGFDDVVGDATAEEREIAEGVRLGTIADRALRAGDSVALRAAVKRLEPLLTRANAPDWALVTGAKAHVRLGDQGSARALLARVGKNGCWIDGVAELAAELGLGNLMAGLFHKNIEDYLQQAREARFPNYHGPVSLIGLALVGMARAGESARANELLKSVMMEAKSWHMEQWPWVEAEVCTELAKIAFRLGQKTKANELLKLACERASDPEALTSIIRVLATMEAWDAAVALANRISAGENRRKALVPLLVRAGRLADARKACQRVHTPEEACDLAWQVVLSLD